MWLTLLWQNKGLVAIGVLILFIAGLLVAVKVQSSRLKVAQSANKTLETERDVAIEAHDQLTKEVARQRRIVEDREIARQQQEKDYVRLQQTLAVALRDNRAWANALIPDGVREALSTLPEAPSGDTRDPDIEDVGPPVPGGEQ